MRAFVAPVVLVALAAGCLTPAADTAAPLEPAAPADESLARVEVGYEGRTMNGVCVGTIALVHCSAVGGENTAHDLELPAGDVARRLEGEVAWTARSPLTATLVVFVYVRDPDGGMRYEDGFPRAEGPSPLALDFDLAPLAGQELGIGVSAWRGQGALVAGGGYSAEQPFAVVAEIGTAREAI